MSKHNANDPQVAMIDLGSITADGDVFGAYLPKKSVIKGAYLANGANVAASNTDFALVKLMNGLTEIASLDTRAAAQNGLTANEPKALVVNEANSVVPAGSYLKASYDESGTIGLTSAKLFIEYYPL